MTIEEFVGKVWYDEAGQLILHETEDRGVGILLDVRGWGAIQNMFPTETDALNFQDSVGEFIAEAIKEKINRGSNEIEESELYECLSEVDVIIDSRKEETYNYINTRIKLLKDIVTDNWDNDKNEPSDFGKLSRLLQENRIVDNMHVGQQSSFFEDGVDGKLKTLEWFLGSFVNIIETQGFIAMNSWLNMKSDHIDNL